MTDSRSSHTHFVRYAVRAVRDPAALLRVLELFALRNLVPETVDCRANDDGCLDIVLEVPGLKAHDAGVLERKLGQLVVTETVSAEVLPETVFRRLIA